MANHGVLLRSCSDDGSISVYLVEIAGRLSEATTEIIFTARTGHITVRCLTNNVRRLEANTGGTWRDRRLMAAHG